MWLSTIIGSLFRGLLLGVGAVAAVLALTSMVKPDATVGETIASVRETLQAAPRQITQLSASFLATALVQREQRQADP
jgi:ABC-type thiamin/hydroxymethylpyrimidine transport system permease subunit